MSAEADLIAARELAALASENVRLQARVAALEAVAGAARALVDSWDEPSPTWPLVEVLAAALARVDDKEAT